MQERRHATIAVPALVAGQLNDPSEQARLVAGDVLDPPLRAARLVQNLASPTIRHPGASEGISNVLDRETPFHRAQKFPEAASFKIALSSSASAKRRFSRAFSFSSSFRRFA